MKGITLKEKLAAALRSKLSASAIITRLPKTKPDDNIVILFTSGSEKDPKAVQLTHKNLGSNIKVLNQAFGLSEKDIIMSILPLFHVFGFNANFWAPLMIGCKSVTYANPLDYKKIPAIVREEEATIIAAPPVFFAGYLKESQPGDFTSLRLVIPGADKTPDWVRQGDTLKNTILNCVRPTGPPRPASASPSILRMTTVLAVSESLSRAFRSGSWIWIQEKSYPMEKREKSWSRGT